MIICKDIYPWADHTDIDVYKGADTFYTYEGYGFQLEKSGKTQFDSLVLITYFGLTTLTTIGYGDVTPISYQEKLMVAFILMIAVTVFSIIMANFLEILQSF